MLDQLSPVAPARVRAVLLPIGQIKRARFLTFAERLQPENVVRLGDISPDARPNRNMFSPLAFPTGSIVYDLTTFIPPATHLALSPFELYREPLVIIALADALELDHISYRGNHRRSLNGNGVPTPEHNLRELHQDLEDLRDRYPKALAHQLLLFDYTHEKSAPALPDGLIAVPPVEDCRTTTMKTIMCDISSLLLAEMTTLAKSIQGMSMIESPSSAQISRQNNASSWGPGQAEMLSRRNSQYSLPANSRSESPAGSTDRSQARMSMPANLRSNSNSPIPRLQSGTSTNGSAPDLPTTFEEIVGPNITDRPNLQRAVTSRYVTGEGARDPSRDRVVTQGFGSSSASERARNKGKARVGIVVGSLYLCAGRWGDALKELVEAAAISKNNLDHLWHGKALDNIVVSMLMLAWAGLDFQIPQICYVSAEKATGAPTSQEQRAPAGSRLAALQNLAALLPELLDRIVNLYARAANNTGESLPQYPFSESIIRFSKLLGAIHLSGGFIDDDVLRSFVVGTPPRNVPTLSIPRLNIMPMRTTVVTLLYRAFPTSSSPENLSIVDRTIILSGIASVLGSLGYQRKKAMVTREVVSVLIPGLVQARIKGAAEMGVHPAAGLAALNAVNGNSHGAGALDLGEGDIESGVDTFLTLLGQTYGVVVSKVDVSQDGQVDDSNEVVIARIMKNAAVRAFGGHSLKMDVLRSCINLSEALPDFHGVLKFTADLLRTAGSGVAPGPRSVDASPSMSREEQIRLATNITRTLTAAKNLGVKGIAAEYWDEFLLRGVELETLPPTRTPIPHSRSDLPGAIAVTASQEVNPFIYNPFLRTPDAAAIDHVLIAGEGAVFRVTLQNPYDFDVEIESIKLEAEGTDFESAIQKTVIGPYRTQILTVSGTARAAGLLKMVGCIIKVRGCRERRFPIFVDSWQPQRETKVKTIGVNTIFKPKDRPTSIISGPTTVIPMTPPRAVSLGLNVIDRQPIVVVKSTSLSQSAVMILEGERKVFSITLQNLSKETPVDLLLFSFKDSTQAPLQVAMNNRDASPAEVYECELLFARKQALRWRKRKGQKMFIAPGGTATYDMEVLGRPGLTSAVVQIDYAHLGVSPNEIEDKFHTRQVSLDLTVTVNASIELARMDVLPITGRMPRALLTGFEGLLETGVSLTPDDYCLLVLDLRNAWPCPLQLRLELEDGRLIEDEILPGLTSRLMFPIRRLYIEDPAAAIPVLDPSRQRQFVVSTGQVSADFERSSREAFWYREGVLRMLQGSWATKSGPDRKGEVEFRGIRLSPRMIEAIKIDDIGVELSIGETDAGVISHELIVDQFSTLNVKISNRTAVSMHPLVRLQPSIRNQPRHDLTLDLSKKLAWNGLMQQTLPLLSGNQTTEFSLGITALARGEYEISASVEEARLQESPLPETNGHGRPRANTSEMRDAVLGAKERRIWHSREPCLLVVKDEDSDDDE